jgi:hypothetical protein
MARVAVRHKNITAGDAKKRPVRKLVPEGRYAALIPNAKLGASNTQLSKLTVEFQITGVLDEETNAIETDTEEAKPVIGQRMFQDFLLEEDTRYPDLAAVHRYELVKLLDACDAPYDDDGFDTDDIVGKGVLIRVVHREGNTLDEDGNKRVFANVKDVDNPEPVNEDDLV